MTSIRTLGATGLAEKHHVAAAMDLALELNKIAGEHHGAPAIMFDAGTMHVVWDGPFEWTQVTMNVSIYAGSQGNYSMKSEFDIFEIAKKHGVFFEAYDSSSRVSIYDG